MTLNPVEILGRVPFNPSRPAIPLFIGGVAAGFPSPADDYIDRNLDLHEHLIEHPAATFFVRACGTSMVRAGIHDGDLLVVDRALEPRDGHVVIAVVHGELAVKRLRHRQGRLYLVSDGNGLPMHVVQQLAGHSDIQTTQTYYLSVHEDDLAKARKVQGEVVGELPEARPTDTKLTQRGPNRGFPQKRAPAGFSNPLSERDLGWRPQEESNL